MPATIEDVARLAMVAPSTVSRVINGSPHVRAATKIGVERAIKELDFVPSAFGTTISRKSWRRLNLLLPDVSEPYYGALAQQVEICARRLGYQISILSTEFDPDWERQFLLGARRRSTDGFICASPLIPIDQLRQVSEHVPLVCLDRNLPNQDIPSVEIDNVQAAYSVVKHLADLGHRRIAFVGPAPARLPGLDRGDGYRLALRDVGVEPSPELLWTKPEPERLLPLEFGARVADHHLDAGAHPTAIFAASDMMAIGVMHALYQRGLRVPEDVALAGFDDISVSAFLNPPLTTVTQPSDRIAEVAVDMAIRLIEGRELQERHVLIPSELRIRRSSGGPIQEDAR